MTAPRGLSAERLPSRAGRRDHRRAPRPKIGGGGARRCARAPCGAWRYRRGGSRVAGYWVERPTPDPPAAMIVRPLLRWRPRQLRPPDAERWRAAAAAIVPPPAPRGTGSAQRRAWRGQAARRAGTAANGMGPYWRQPMRRSQVRGGSVGFGPLALKAK